MAPIAVLREDLRFYNVPPLNETYLTDSRVRDFKELYPSYQSITWLGAFCNYPARKLSQMWTDYRTSQTKFEEEETKEQRIVQSDPNHTGSLREPEPSQYGELSYGVSKIASDINQVRQSGKLYLPIPEYPTGIYLIEHITDTQASVEYQNSGNQTD